MLAGLLLAVIVLMSAAAEGFGQAAPPAPQRTATAASAWRPAGEGGDAAAAAPAGRTTEKTPAGAARPSATPADKNSPPTAEAPRRPSVRVTNGDGTLPNEQGQVWREYDISPYTLRVTTTERPEQAIVDWILRETGYEAWHSEPLGILSATRRTLRVYHTPQMQAAVADLVDRFVASEAETSTFSLRVVTVDYPNWRARAQRLLRPVAVQTPGVSAWLLEKEDAAVLLADLQRRSDYREHSSPYLLVNNGQSTAVSAVRPRPYIRDVVVRGDLPSGFEEVPGQVEEGFSLDFSPLLSADRKIIDATIKCGIDQVEKLVPVMLEVPTAVSPRQRAKIDVPQVTHFRFHERFRWPVEQVLLVSLGMVALPLPVDGKPAVAGIPLPFGSTPARADLLILVDCKGQTRDVPRAARPGEREAKTYRGRY
jgi:hypothetical protein